MGRGLTIVAVLLIACFALFGAVVFVTREEDGVAVDALLSEELTLQVARADQTGRDVDFAALTDFAWDRLYIADPRAPRAEIDKALGFAFKGDITFITGDLLIFVRDGALERFADYRGEGRFEGIDRPVAVFARDDAVFEIRSLVMTPK